MKTSPANNMDVKRRNRSNTLRCILTCDRISQMELSQRLGLSWPTVLQNVKELTELGLIREVGSYESTGGRKAKAYAPVRDAKLALGLDITRKHVSVVLVDLSGQVVRSLHKTCPFSLDDGCAKVWASWQISLTGSGPATLGWNRSGRSICGISRWWSTTSI